MLCAYAPKTDTHEPRTLPAPAALELTRVDAFLNGEDDIFDVLEKQASAHSNDGDAARLKDAMRESIKLLKQAQKKIEQQSSRIRDLEQLKMKDELTGMMSRSAFSDSLERELARIYRQPDRGGVFITIELENLSAIQTQHGSLAGRTALKLLASNITQEARTMDIAGRIGDNEFSLMCMDTTRDAILSRIQTLNFRLNKLSFVWKNKEISLHVSLSLKGCSAQDSVESFLPGSINTHRDGNFMGS